jgi:hypothetical protein|tara:strand:+ start:259 stop:507 length:249 start_codon:yes stop_codon:yes gene_type:complete
MSNEIKEKENRITDYIKSMVSIEESMEPYKEQKRSLKGNYVENGWLSKEEISLAVKAYRMVKGDVDIEQLMDFYEHVQKTVR